DRLVLAAQAARELGAQAAQRLAGGVDAVPVALDGLVLGGESLHDGTLGSRSVVGLIPAPGALRNFASRCRLRNARGEMIPTRTGCRKSSHPPGRSRAARPLAPPRAGGENGAVAAPAGRRSPCTTFRTLPPRREPPCPRPACSIRSTTSSTRPSAPWRRCSAARPPPAATRPATRPRSNWTTPSAATRPA